MVGPVGASLCRRDRRLPELAGLPVEAEAICVSLDRIWKSHTAYILQYDRP